MHSKSEMVVALRGFAQLNKSVSWFKSGSFSIRFGKNFPAYSRTWSDCIGRFSFLCLIFLVKLLEFFLNRNEGGKVGDLISVPRKTITHIVLQLIGQIGYTLLATFIIQLK